MVKWKTNESGPGTFGPDCAWAWPIWARLGLGLTHLDPIWAWAWPVWARLGLGQGPFGPIWGLILELP